MSKEFHSKFNKKILTSFIWSAASLLVGGGLSMIVRLILAYILTPEDFGILGMAVIFTGIVEVITEQGIAQAIIQKDKNSLTEDHYNSAFTLSLLLGVGFFFLVCFIIAPFAAWFYDENILILVLPVISISLLIRPFRIVALTQLSKDLRFKELSKIEIISTFGASFASLLLAYYEAGVWSLVLFGVIQTLIAVPLFGRYVKWKNKFGIKKKETKEIFDFGIYVVLNNILVFSAKNIDYLFVGKMLGTVPLGLYTLAFLLTDVVRVKFMVVMNKVMYPVYAKMKDQKDVIKNYYLSVIKMNAYILFPLMVTFISSGEKIIAELFGYEKWSGAVDPLRILAIAMIIHAIGGTSASIFRAIGLPKLEFKISIIETLFITIPALFIGIKYYALEGAAWAIVISRLFSRFIYQILMRKHFGLTEIDIIKSIFFPSIVCVPFYFINIKIESFELSLNIYYYAGFVILNFLFYFLVCGFLIRDDLKKVKSLFKLKSRV